MATVVENPGSTTRQSNRLASDTNLVGISYPFRKEAGEFPKKSINADAVKNDLIMLFDTPLGSRAMKPLYGSNKEEIVFESRGPLLRARLERNIRQTIYLNEPRVKVQFIQIEEKKTTVTATIYYLIQGVQDSVVLEIERPVPDVA